MDISEKGAEAAIADFNELSIKIKWTGDPDFDLAALYEDKTGDHGLVYFGEFGDTTRFPFIQISGDEGREETGEKEETIRITGLDDMKYVWLLCWDYDGVQEGTAGRFDESDIILSVTRDGSEQYDITLLAEGSGNTAIIATIDNSGSSGAKLVNNNKMGMLVGLSNLQQLIDLIDK